MGRGRRRMDERHESVGSVPRDDGSEVDFDMNPEITEFLGKMVWRLDGVIGIFVSSPQGVPLIRGAWRRALQQRPL